MRRCVHTTPVNLLYAAVRTDNLLPLFGPRVDEHGRRGGECDVASVLRAEAVNTQWHGVVTH